MVRFFKFLSTLAMYVTTMAFAANEAPQSFTLDGQLTDHGLTTPLLDPGAKIRVQILNPSKTCVLYDEEQSVNTTSTNGRFNIQVGTLAGNAKRKSLDSGNSMSSVYSNNAAIPARAVPGQTCVGSSYTPTAGDARYVRLIVTPSSGSPDTLTPDMSLDSVPNALVAQTVQGLGRSSILQVNAGANLTQANLESLLSGSGISNFE